jgi:hypothetical protein
VVQSIEEARLGDVPPGWGQDELTKLLDNVRANLLGTFANTRGVFERIAAIDRAFLVILQGSANPGNELLTMLFFRCHSAFRAAAGLAMAGQAVESYSLNRAALEFAGYGVHIFRNRPLEKVWLDRHQDESSTAAARKAFSHIKVLKSVLAADRHTGERFEALYQQTIDLGAHPNQLAVTGNMEIVDHDGIRQMRSIYLHASGLPQNLALKTTATCGVVTLDLMQFVYEARFELVGLNATLPHLKAGL